MNVFDIIGPVMIGPSSSHTAGAARIGGIAHSLLGCRPVRAQLVLYGSFAKTYKGHGTDKALIAGILGMAPDDIRLREAPRLAAEQGLAVELTTAERSDLHPNTAAITLVGENGRQISLQGSSIGGGNVRITRINGMEVDLAGQHDTFIVLHRDAPGTIANVTELMAAQRLNICRFHLSRQEKGGTACMTIEVDGATVPDLNAQIERLPNVLSSTMLPIL